MRRLLLLTILLFVVVLSGCSANREMDPNEELYSFDSYLMYDLETLRYSTSNKADILYEVGSVSTDYIITKNRMSELSENEEAAYKSTLSLIDTVNVQATTFSLQEITTYSSSDLADYAYASNVELTITDVITFNTIKAEIEEFQTSNIPIISREHYVAALIDRELTTEEVNGFYLLQEEYFVLVDNNDITYSFKTNTFEELLVLFDTYMGYVPSNEDLINLELAYNVLNTILLEW